MPKLRPETQSARREHILDAAERCFAMTGFHRTTMHDICRMAGVSPGALYVYFDNKEALIEGITERDRAEFAEQLSMLEEAPDFIAALEAVGGYYLDPARAHKSQLCLEIGVEATRNARIAEILWRFDREVTDSLERLFRRLKSEGRIAPAVDIQRVTAAFCMIGDGLFWRHTVFPNDFKAEGAMPIALDLIRMLLRPVEPATRKTSETARSPGGE
ncbi:MAG: TetR/AcrR family transcriptional regulator [Hyphomicrobiaceae bacterium]|nr:TetR/AcrR family transcriptional regulator [Hyphomicrobiaceae bacterium]